MIVLPSLLLAVLGGHDVNYIVVDIRTRNVIKQDWPEAGKAIPVGSLVKPFLALASSGPYPEFVCHGAADRCWLAKGHGRIGFREALANSCNAYFLQLARGVDADALNVIAATFGIPPPNSEIPEARIGLGKDWQISPIALARAYSELSVRSAEPRVAEILLGLKLAAESGTASAIGRGALAKTGTAPSTASGKHAGDGFTMILAPADDPRVAILVRERGVPGAVAAKSAAAILRREVP